MKKLRNSLRRCHDYQLHLSVGAPVPSESSFHIFQLTSIISACAHLFMLVAADKQSNFKVGLINVRPSTTAQLLAGIFTCGYGPQVAAAGQTMFVQCAGGLPPARYVVIIGRSSKLEICELEVYGKGIVQTIRENQFIYEYCVTSHPWWSAQL